MARAARPCKSSSVAAMLTIYPQTLFSPTTCLLLLLLPLLLLLLLLVNRWPNRIPVNWPVLGMLPSFLSNVHRILDWKVDVLRQGGCNFMFWGPWFPALDFLIVADPANLNHILSLNHSNYPKGDDFKDIFDVLGDGIFNSDDHTWQYQRRKAHAIFGSRGFRASVSGRTREKVEKGLLPLIAHVADQREAVDLQDVFLRFTFDLTCTIILGVDPGCLSAEFPTIPFSKAAHDIEEVVFFRHTVPVGWWKLLRWLGVGPEKRIAAALVVADRFIAEHVSRIRGERKRREGKESPEFGILSSYLDDPLLKDGKSVDTFLRDTVLSFLLAGNDSTAAALTWFLFMLSKNPGVQSKILEELSVLAPSNQGGGMAVFEAEALDGLVYLHAALCETLRLFPPLPLNHKAALREDVLPSGHRVAPGMRIIISIHAIARMAGVWGEDCEQFRPERWITEKGTLRHELRHKIGAFSFGSRSCLGREMALTQVKMAVAAVIYNFEVEVAEGHVVRPQARPLILLMSNGLKVKIRKRSIYTKDLVLD